MVEIFADNDRYGKRPFFKLRIDGDVVHPSMNNGVYSFGEIPGEDFLLRLSEKATIDQLSRYTWDELPSGIRTIDLNDYIEIAGFRIVLSFLSLFAEDNVMRIDDKFTVLILIDTNLFHWKQSWSFLDFANTYLDTAFATGRYSLKNDQIAVDPNEHGAPFFVLTERISKSAVTLREVLDTLKRDILAFYKTTVSTLEQRIDPNILSLRFDFPEIVRVACGQYLLYFAQFLHDTGVPAATDLKHEANLVHFTLTPHDIRLPLYKIRQVLDLYLHLPTNATFGEVPDRDTPIAAQRLQSALQTFRYQLTLAGFDTVALAPEIAAQARQLPVSPLESMMTNYGWFDSGTPEVAQKGNLSEIQEGVKRYFTHALPPGTRNLVIYGANRKPHQWLTY